MQQSKKDLKTELEIPLLERPQSGSTKGMTSEAYLKQLGEIDDPPEKYDQKYSKLAFSLFTDVSPFVEKINSLKPGRDLTIHELPLPIPNYAVVKKIGILEQEWNKEQ
jgi:hypothetical protein